MKQFYAKQRARHKIKVAYSTTHEGGFTMRELTNEELKQVSGGSQPPGQLGYEGQPGNQGGGGGNNGNSSGQNGYEGQPGNQGG